MKEPHRIIAVFLPSNHPIADKRGQPAKHANPAAKQKTYREHGKAKGLLEVKRFVLEPLIAPH